MIDQRLLYKLLGEKIKDARLGKKPRLTQEELARKLGVKRTSITNIEKGIQKPPIHIIYKLCAIFKMEIHDVLPTVGDVLEIDTKLRLKGFNPVNVPPSVAQVINKRIISND